MPRSCNGFNLDAAHAVVRPELGVGGQGGQSGPNSCNGINLDAAHVVVRPVAVAVVDLCVWRGKPVETTLENNKAGKKKKRGEKESELPER